jgi:beta-glucosidase
VAIVFATKWSTEGQDQADLSLPSGQDALIAAVAAANPKTIVVLETGNPVVMPWLNQTAAVLQAWYPGGRGGEALAAVLFGDANPSGKLPVTFPASLDQLPRPVIDGYYDFEPSFTGDDPRSKGVTANYDIEGSDLGYRWNARKGHKALFPFGFGLSYTSFATSGLKLSGLDAKVTVKNTGPREGATVVQLYLVSRNGAAKQRLAAFQRVNLAAGASQQVALKIDPRIIADWKDGGWSIAGGTYGFALGEDAQTLDPVTTVRLATKAWKD